MYSCAQHEFTIATENSPGVKPFDTLELLDYIKELKSSCDYLVVLYHGGKEHYRYSTHIFKNYVEKWLKRVQIELYASIVVV